MPHFVASDPVLHCLPMSRKMNTTVGLNGLIITKLRSTVVEYPSTLDKQRICVNTQLKSSKKQLKLNVCVPKSNSNDWYAITCDVIAYRLVHLVSIWVINKCQSDIDFFLPVSANITPVL